MKPNLNVKEGDLLRHEVAGAGGWGDPLERDPALVLNDLRNEFVKERAACKDYGVVLGPPPLAVDEPATGALRQQMRVQRKWDVVPLYSWGLPLAAE